MSTTPPAGSNDQTDLARWMEQALEAQGLISPAEWKLSRAQGRATGRPAWQIVAELGLVDQGTLNRLKSQYDQANRLPAGAQGTDWNRPPTLTPTSSAPTPTPTAGEATAERSKRFPASAKPGATVPSASKQPESPAENSVTSTPETSESDTQKTSASPLAVEPLAEVSKPSPISKPFEISTDDLGEGPSASTLVEQVLSRALEARATDLHFDPQADGGLRIRLRVDGQLRDLLRLPASSGLAVLSRIKILANLDIVEKRKGQDGHLLFEHAQTSRNIRVATLPTCHGERLVLRILDHQLVRLDLDHLGLLPQQTQTIKSLLAQPYGILLVAGPVGNGKTTTLYSAIEHLNHPWRNIVTIEDPVEIHIDGVNQVPVDPRSGWTFAQALRACLRQDPDVVMVGEIRDDETAHIAVRASLTGALVLSTMHASDTAGAVGNLYNYGIPGYVISSSLLGVMAQRLVRLLDPNACEAFEPDAKTLSALNWPDQGARPTFYRPRQSAGSSRSDAMRDGYQGRCCLAEVMSTDETLRDLIFQQASKRQLREAALKSGMVPLLAHAHQLLQAGKTSVEEVFRVLLLDERPSGQAGRSSSSAA